MSKTIRTYVEDLSERCQICFLKICKNICQKILYIENGSEDMSTYSIHVHREVTMRDYFFAFAGVCSCEVCHVHVGAWNWWLGGPTTQSLAST